MKWEYLRIQVKGATDDPALVYTHHLNDKINSDRYRPSDTQQGFDKAIGQAGFDGWEIVHWSPTDCFFKRPLGG